LHKDTEPINGVIYHTYWRFIFVVLAVVLAVVLVMVLAVILAAILAVAIRQGKS